jgi:hypothetical protein
LDELAGGGRDAVQPVVADADDMDLVRVGQVYSLCW